MNDKFSNHEAIDRSGMIAEMFEQYILEHPSVVANQETKQLAERISADLYSLYSQLGALYIS